MREAGGEGGRGEAPLTRCPEPLIPRNVCDDALLDGALRTRERRDLAGVGADQKEEGDDEKKGRPQNSRVGGAHRFCDRGPKRVHRATDDERDGRPSAVVKWEKKMTQSKIIVNDE